MTNIVEIDGVEFEYNSSEKTAQEVVKKIVDFLVKNEITPDEGLYQRDNIHEMTHDLVTDIVEKILKFRECGM